MDSSILKNVEKFIKAESRRRYWTIAVAGLGSVVVIITALLLMAPARAMVGETFCGMEEHTHSEECIGLVLTCGYPADEELGVIDGENPDGTDAEFVESDSAEGGVGAVEGGSEEADANPSESGSQASDVSPAESGSQEINAGAPEGHVHTADCYAEERRLICTEEAAEGHVHTDECYTVQTAQALVCEKAETEGHSHTDSCYEFTVTQTLICSDTSEEHEHTADCYAEESVRGGSPVCGQEEAEPHIHGEGCYETVEERILSCGKEEGESEGAHVHGDECYETVQTLICGMEETAAPEQGTEGMPAASEQGAEGTPAAPEQGAEGMPAASEQGTEGTPAAPEQETEEAPAASEQGTEEASEAGQGTENPEAEEVHVHTEECYGEGPACGLEEHIHDDTCYEKPELYCAEYLHSHEEECYDEEGNVVCGYVAFAVHVHDEKVCYGSKGTLICPLPEIAAHVHTEECWQTPEDGGEPVLSCGRQEIELHTHTAECYDEEENLICGKLEIVEHVHSAECLVKPEKPVEIVEVTFEGGNFIITASYESDALPEDAELFAAQITEESDAEHYARRQAQYEEAVGEEGAPMRALLKIGFYVDGEEVEPEKPVSITVQMLDENGMEDGEPVTVIHFHSEDETETVKTLDGGVAENGSATFEMDQFSEIAIGYGPKVIPDKVVSVDETIVYEDEEFRINFRLQGDVTIPVELLSEAEKAAVAKAVSGSEKVDGTAQQESDPEKDIAESGTETSAESNSGEVSAESDTETQEESNSGEVSAESDTETQPESDSEGTAAESDAETQPESTGENLNLSVGETEVVGSYWEDGIFYVSIKAEGLEENLVFMLKALDENTNEYASVKAYDEESGDNGEKLVLRVWSYSLNYRETELDLSACSVAAEITPTQKLVSTVAEAVSAEAPEKTDDAPEDVEGQSDLAFVVMEIVGEGSEIQVGARSAAFLGEGETDQLSQSLALELNANIMVASISEERANPKFKVEYYANLAIMNTKGTNALPLIDTSGKQLPVNKKGTGTSPNGNDIKNIYVNDAGKVLTTLTETQVYETEVYEYIKAPTVNYMNELVENSHYELKKIKILTCTNTSQTHVHDSEKCYTVCGEVICGKKNHDHSEACNNGQDCKKEEHAHNSDCFTIHFANRYPRDTNGNFILQNAATGTVATDKDGKRCEKTDYGYKIGEGTNAREYVVLTDETVLRFVYEVTEDTPDFEVAFYDYDITNGYLYTGVNSNSAVTGDAKVTSTQTNRDKNKNVSYGYTKQSGINSAGNYTGSGTKLAFGNVNTGTTMGENLWDGNLLNKFNGTQSGHPSVTGSYKGCTFGLVTKLVDGKIQYVSTVSAPKLFNEGEATGKTAYDNGQYTLSFKRAGDTYTLAAVKKGTAVAVPDLDSFGHPSPYSGKVWDSIWTNDFWPMDTAESYGTNGHDIKFGSYDLRNNRAYAGSTTKGEPGSTSGSKKAFPYSDDGKDHNSYFGMTYKVSFELSKDYVGPLEYYFFGDDDMWVFLDDQLVCDIGGVHSSVGEYVNLWDYLEKGSEGTHTLTFFYTERGASGSTCWMQFTLPSVSSLTPEQITGRATNSLKVGKSVIGTDAPTGLDYEFSIKFTKGDENLPDDYRYVKYAKDGSVIGDDLIIWDGGTFLLGDGEYIEVKYLPVGTTYSIAETGRIFKDGNLYTDNRKYEIIVDGTNAEQGVTSGDIASTDTTVNYINDYGYALPETGGTGTRLYTIAGAILATLGAGLLYRKKFRERRV
ncbi:MAG: fibro-slime domain-containing protein [bacterium]|nr:fibro-slime domain-containing protein [bacterium]